MKRGESDDSWATKCVGMVRTEEDAIDMLRMGCVVRNRLDVNGQMKQAHAIVDKCQRCSRWNTTSSLPTLTRKIVERER